MRRFTSRYLNKVDRKGRVSVPAAYRSALDEAGATVVYLKRNRADGAIDGLTEAFMDEVQARIDALDIGSEERASLEDEYFAESVDMRIDPDGRIILSRDLLEFAGIDEHALFVGLGQRFQIWSPTAYEDQREARAAMARNLSLKRVPNGEGGR